MAINSTKSTTSWKEFQDYQAGKKQTFKTPGTEPPKNADELIDKVEEYANSQYPTRDIDKQIDRGDIDAAIEYINRTTPNDAERDSTVAFLNDFKEFLNTHQNLDANGNKYFNANEIDPNIPLNPATNIKFANGGVNSNNVIDSARRVVSGIVSDGVIDEFRQVQDGACWIYAAINAANNDANGKALIKEMIKSTPDGNFSVTFPGDPDQKPYIVSRDRLGNEATGDIDALILQEAFRQHYSNQLPIGGAQTESLGRNINDGGSADEALNLLLGRHSSNVISLDPSIDKGVPNIAVAKEQLAQLLNNDKDGITITFSGRSTPNGTVDFSQSGHAFNVTNIDMATNTVTYMNPFFGNQKFTVNVDEFLAQARNVIYREIG